MPPPVIPVAGFIFPAPGRTWTWRTSACGHSAFSACGGLTNVTRGHLARRDEGIKRGFLARAQSEPQNYNLLFPDFFAFAHLALAAAESAALPAALNFLLGF